MTNRNEIHNTSEHENNTGNQINTGRVLVAAGALAAVAVGSGAAALLTSGNSTDDNQPTLSRTSWSAIRATSMECANESF